MVINTNTSALNAARLLAQSTSAQSKSLQRLSSGAKIVAPQDDAAGLAQSMKMTSETSRHKATISVLTNVTSFYQTADGFLVQAQRALDRMGELSILAMDQTKTDADRANYNAEFQQLVSLINDIRTKKFNDKNLFYNDFQVVNNGTNIAWTTAKTEAEALGGHLATITSLAEQKFIEAYFGGFTNPMWIGATDAAVENSFEWVTGEPFSYTNWNSGEPNNSGNEDYVQLNQNLTWNDLNSGLQHYLVEKDRKTPVGGQGELLTLDAISLPYLTDSISSFANATTALTNIKTAISELASQRAEVGSLLTRFESTIGSLSILTENLQAAVSQIVDVNVAQEATEFARSQILVQSGTSMLAQANALPQSVLKLIG